MHPQLLNGKPLSYEEKQYLTDAKYQKSRKLHDRDLTKYHCDILRDRRPEHTMNDDIQRGSTNSVYAKLNQVEYLSRSQYLPFTEPMFIGDKQHDPRGYTNDPLMEKVKQYSYDRAKHTDANLYPRNAPQSIIDGQRTQQKLQSDMQQTILDRKDRLKIFSQSVTNNVFVRPRPQQSGDDILQQQHAQQTSQDQTEMANESLAPQLISMPRGPIQMHNLQVSDHKLLVSDYDTMIKASKYQEDPELMMKMMDSFQNRHDTNTDKFNDQLSDNLRKLKQLQQNTGSIQNNQYEAVKLEILDKLLSCVTYQQHNIFNKLKSGHITKQHHENAQLEILDKLINGTNTNQASANTFNQNNIKINIVQGQTLADQVKSLIAPNCAVDFNPQKASKCYQLFGQQLQEQKQSMGLSSQMDQANIDPSKVIKLYAKFDQQLRNSNQTRIYNQIALSELNPNKVTKLYQKASQQFNESKLSCVYKQKIQNISDIAALLQSITQHPQCKLSKEQQSIIKQTIQYIQLRQSNESCVINNQEDINRVMQDLSSVIVQQQQQNNKIGKQWQHSVQQQLNSESKLSESVKSQIMKAINAKQQLNIGSQQGINIPNHLFNQQKDHLQKTLNCRNTNLQWLHTNPEISQIQMIIADQLMQNGQLSQQRTLSAVQPGINGVFNSLDDQNRAEIQSKLLYIAIEQKLKQNPNYFNGVDQRVIQEQLQSQIASSNNGYKANINQLLKAVLNDNKTSALFEQMPKIKQHFNQQQIMALLECMVSESANQQLDQSIGSIQSSGQQVGSLCSDIAGSTIFCNYRNIIPSKRDQSQESQFGSSMNAPIIKTSNLNLYQQPRNDISTQEYDTKYNDETFNVAHNRVNGNLRPSRESAYEDAAREL